MRAVPDMPAVLVAALLAAGGCAGPLNEQVGLVGARLPALEPSTTETELNAGPSIAGTFDRTDWPLVTVCAPQEQVANHPQFTGFFTWRGQRPPWDTAYPDVTSALVDPTDGLMDLADASTEVVLSTATIVAVPVAGALAGPWIVNRSPSEPYQRLPPP